MDFYYQGAWRMDWGFGNPNKTATLIACLMLAVWLVAGIWRRGFWLALPLATALGWCLVQTYSRGGMLALLAGAAVLLAWAPRPWPKARTIAVVASLWIVGLFILYSRAETRYGQGLFSDDQSINSRLVVWKHFPEMLAAAPWGWGWGKAGDAYTQWFQPLDQSINYLNLLNSHFTWMAEGGWAFSIFYIAGWLAAILICWPAQDWRIGSVPLAVWIALGVGGFFSQVEDSLWLWAVPLLLLGVAIYLRFQRKTWPGFGSAWVAGLGSVCVIALVIVVGWAGAALPIEAESRAVMLGEGANKTVLFVDREVMGKLYGHTLRKYLSESGANVSGRTYIVTETPEYAVAADASQIILSGRMARDMAVAPGPHQVGRVILINPVCFPEEMRWDGGVASKTCVYFGEYSQFPSRSSWETCSSVRYLVIDGAGNFVPAWPGAIWNPAGI
jgi:hypothetical protein